MKTLKINFCDFWPGFDKTNNYFYWLLKTKYDVIVDEIDPELLFFSVDYANERKRDNYSCKKIFFTGESVSANFDNEESLIINNHAAKYSIGKCDYAFTFDVTDDPRHFRLPLWVIYIDWFKKGGYGNPGFLLPLDKVDDNEYIRTPKTKFCAAVFSNPTPERIDFIKRLNKYKKVDCFGGPFGNKTEGEEAKYEILKDYKFSICFENRIRKGYVTEKLFHAKTAGTVPIYWGDGWAYYDFYEGGFRDLFYCQQLEFLLREDKSSSEVMIENIIEDDRNDKRRQSFVNCPLGVDTGKFGPEKVLEFFENTILK